MKPSAHSWLCSLRLVKARQRLPARHRACDWLTLPSTIAALVDPMSYEPAALPDLVRN